MGWNSHSDDSLLQLKDRLSFFYVERGSLSVQDGCIILTDADDNVRYEIPGRATTCVLIGPGTTITSDAVRLAARYGVLLQWVGEQSVRCYSAGRPWGDNTNWLDVQVRCYADPSARLSVAREMFFRRFGVRMERRSIEQLRGLEGVRVRRSYSQLAEEYGIPWNGRRYARGNPKRATDAPNLALNVVNTCLYGVVEAAVNAAGLSPALGFIHSGSRLSFVLDVADLYKTSEIVPLAFRLVRDNGASSRPWRGLESDARLAARDHFRQSRILRRLVQVESADVVYELFPSRSQ